MQRETKIKQNICKETLIQLVTILLESWEIHNLKSYYLFAISMHSFAFSK